MDHRDTRSYYIGYHVQETASGTTWPRVATAWPSRNEQGGFTVQLLAVPLSGTIVFLPSEGEETPTATAGPLGGDTPIPAWQSSETHTGRGLV